MDNGKNAVIFPTNFLSAHDVSEKLSKLRIEISPERLSELAECGYMPHWLFCSGGDEQALFRLPDVKRWLRQNDLMEIKGAPFPKILEVVKITNIGQPATSEQVPQAIQSFGASLRVAPTALISGVYFLCKGGEVVYVGMSTNLYGRVNSHSRDLQQCVDPMSIAVKDFDSALFLPVPRSDLSDVEERMIRILKPRFNRRGKEQEPSEEDRQWLADRIAASSQPAR